jgi:hypothetical protein
MITLRINFTGSLLTWQWVSQYLCDGLLYGEVSSLGRYVFGSEISYNKPPPRLPGLGC